MLILNVCFEHSRQNARFFPAKIEHSCRNARLFPAKKYSFHRSLKQVVNLSCFNMHLWRHPGRAKMLCMLSKMIHKYTNIKQFQKFISSSKSNVECQNKVRDTLTTPRKKKTDFYNIFSSFSLVIQCWVKHKLEFVSRQFLSVRIILNYYKIFFQFSFAFQSKLLNSQSNLGQLRINCQIKLRKKSKVLS